MKTVSWKRKKKEERPDVFVIYKGVTFHPWRVNKGILEQQEQFSTQKGQ